MNHSLTTERPHHIKMAWSIAQPHPLKTRYAARIFTSASHSVGPRLDTANEPTYIYIAVFDDIMIMAGVVYPLGYRRLSALDKTSSLTTTNALRIPTVIAQKSPTPNTRNKMLDQEQQQKEMMDLKRSLEEKAQSEQKLLENETRLNDQVFCLAMLHNCRTQEVSDTKHHLVPEDRAQTGMGAEIQYYPRSR